LFLSSPPRGTRLETEISPSGARWPLRRCASGHRRPGAARADSRNSPRPRGPHWVFRRSTHDCATCAVGWAPRGGEPGLVGPHCPPRRPSLSAPVVCQWHPTPDRSSPPHPGGHRSSLPPPQRTGSGWPTVIPRSAPVQGQALRRAAPRERAVSVAVSSSKSSHGSMRSLWWRREGRTTRCEAEGDRLGRRRHVHVSLRALGFFWDRPSILPVLHRGFRPVVPEEWLITVRAPAMSAKPGHRPRPPAPADRRGPRRTRGVVQSVIRAIYRRAGGISDPADLFSVRRRA